MSFWCPVSVWDMGTHPKVGHVSSSTSSQTTVDMVCDQFWELWLSSSCCRNCFCPNEFSKPASLIWLLRSRSYLVFLQLWVCGCGLSSYLMLLEVLREFIRHVFTSSVGSSALTPSKKKSTEPDLHPSFIFCSGFEFFEFFKGFDLCFIK